MKRLGLLSGKLYCEAVGFTLTGKLVPRSGWVSVDN